MHVLFQQVYRLLVYSAVGFFLVRRRFFVTYISCCCFASGIGCDVLRLACLSVCLFVSPFLIHGRTGPHLACGILIPSSLHRSPIIDNGIAGLARSTNFGPCRPLSCTHARKSCFSGKRFLQQLSFLFILR